jgi:hypothetical protein
MGVLASPSKTTAVFPSDCAALKAVVAERFDVTERAVRWREDFSGMISPEAMTKWKQQKSPLQAAGKFEQYSTTNGP